MIIFTSPSPPVLPLLTFACDESSQITDKYMVLGGIACRSAREHEMTIDLANIKGDRFATTEVKWSKTRRGPRLDLHKEVVDYFFTKLEENYLHFHSFVVPFSDFDHRLMPDGCKDNSVMRMYYQLCLHRPIKKYGKQFAIHIKPDHCDSYLGFKDYVNHLNNDAKTRFEITTKPVRDITFPESHKSAIHQINDIIIGALAHRQNNKHNMTGASSHKCDLAEYVHKKLRGILNRTNFTVWNFLSPHIKKKPPA